MVEPIPTPDAPRPPVCSILLHDPQEIIDAFESNRTVIVVDDTGGKLFPLAFGLEDIPILELLNDFVFEYYDPVCNYFFDDTIHDELNPPPLTPGK